MTRPVYQTADDLRREAGIAETLGRAWNVRLHRYPDLYAVDWFAERDRDLRFVAELKTRTHNPDRYPTLLLSAHKWTALRDVARGMHVPAYLVVQFGDGSIRYGDLEWVRVETARIAGRYDRNDPGDQELCVFLPVFGLTELTRT